MFLSKWNYLLRFGWLSEFTRFRVKLGFVVGAVAFWMATPNFSSLVFGISIATVGEALRVWAAGHLRKGQEVTSSGPYRLIRHPLYFGSSIIGIGVLVIAANLIVSAIVSGYLVLTLWAAAREEETRLRLVFGEEYENYRRGTVKLSKRKFSIERMINNGEHRTLLGFLIGSIVLGMKAWLI